MKKRKKKYALKRAGERISDEAAEMLCQYRDMGFSIEGTEEENRIGVWING